MQETEHRQRCPWASTTQIMEDYHDHQWGVPTHDDRTFFAFLVLEGAQAGLSWLTILSRYEGYRRAFANFDVEQVAHFDDTAYQALLQNPEIIRNRAKITSAIQNAQAFLRVQEEFGSFDAFIWRFVDGIPQQHNPCALSDIPVRSLESDAMSKELKRRGFTFVGTVICYSYMQAMGLVNDHIIDCFRHQEVQDRAFARHARPHPPSQ